MATTLSYTAGVCPASERRTLNPLQSWLIKAGLDAVDLPTLLSGYARRLPQIGVEIVRLWHSELILHPLLGAVDAVWWARDGVVTVSDIRRRRVAEADLPGGPSGHPASHPKEVILRLQEGEDLNHSVLEAAREAGATQYLLLQTHQHGVPTLMTSYAILGPELDNETLSRLRGIHEVFGVVALLHRERTIAPALLRTYLGVDAADRVLAGTVERGDGFTAQAAILFSDLRDFTGISERHSRDEVLGLLSDAFELQVAAIEAHGGQVLKFIGDGLLAIFADDERGASHTCQQALLASEEIERRANEANRQRLARSALPIDYYLALHHGEVMYGNIGAPHRLDFTVIGSAVNKTARLVGLGAREGIKPALSEEFAEFSGRAVERVGCYSVKGIDELSLWRVLNCDTD